MKHTPPPRPSIHHPSTVPTWSRRTAWAAPPVLAVVVLLHRNDPAEAMDLAGSTTTWIWIHVVLIGALVLLSHAVRSLLADADGRAATVARATLPVALVTYAAFDGLVGLGTGVLVERAESLGPDAAQLVEHWWAVPTPINIVSGVAQLSWVTVLGATAVARSTQSAPKMLVPLLVALAGTFPILHVRPVGLVPVALLATALWLDHRHRSKGAATTDTTHATTQRHATTGTRPIHPRPLHTQTVDPMLR